MRGVRDLPTGRQVFAKVRGRFVSKVVPLDTTDAKCEQHRAELIARAKYDLAHPKPKPSKTFADDAVEYLSLVTGMPSYDDRKYEIEQWAEKLGHKPRATIAARDIRAVLESWRVSGRADGTGGLSNASLNRRRTSLMHLWRTLDGKSAANPVKDVATYDESASKQIRAIDPRILYRVIARVDPLKWKARRKKSRGRRRNPSKTRARLRLMLWTGFPAAVVMKLKPEDFDLKAETVWVRGRRKGKGAKPRLLPLVPGAKRAVECFIAANAFGAFSTSSMHTSFQEALGRENAHRLRYGHPAIKASPYSLRHCMGTELARRVKDERVIQDMMLLTNPSQVRRYTEAATADRLEAARQALREQLLGRKVAPRLQRKKEARNRRKTA